jgi:hypothetical protein
MTPNERRLLSALADLLEQLEGIGIYIPGNDEGQTAETEGLSFARAEKLINKYKAIG